MESVAAITGVTLNFGSVAGGAGLYSDTGEALAPGTIRHLREDYDAVLKGPVGLPNMRALDGTEAGLLGGLLRMGLDTYANIRPMKLLSGVTGRRARGAGAIDYVIVRENTEGLYLSRSSGVATNQAACDQLLITRHGTERIVRYAFELSASRSGAPKDSRRRVTCVDKSNVLRSFALFRRVFLEVADDYPDIEAECMYADAAGYSIVANPERFDVLVMENFLGDLLSDVGAATIGGLGMCPSGNIGAEAAYFEPIHGSAPGIAGTGRANPTAQILSGAMLFDHLGAHVEASLIRWAVSEAYRSGGIVLVDGCPMTGTDSVTEAVIDGLVSAPYLVDGKWVGET